MNNIKILHFGRTDISEGTDVNKTRKSKECDIYKFFFFFWYLALFKQKVSVSTICVQ